MLIGLISDTHIPDRGKNLPDKVFESFENVDMILHAGDVTSQEVLDKLSEFAPVIAIQGNTDRMVGLDLPKTEIVEANGMRIGLNHGEVYPRADTQQLLYLAKQLDVDILVTGHSHQPKIEQIDGTLLLNPGSPMVPRLADRTIMLLEIDDDKNVDVELVKVGSPVCSSLDITRFKH
ncbi:YfcE family phosphodiesterase [uncultured Methanobrevibacter sp.]|uniref:YfcE family phosphodiesterase n=1 Tax=uncultured Methanobrevibacter sp. TaxID=253161 RepID=UPI0026E04F27|nr:YfcE family phosphodiesterase [uncultured Methanobrevibacter sp.]